MGNDYETADTDDAVAEGGVAKTDSAEDLLEVHAEALRRFDDTVLPQQEMRQRALIARRFASIPGAMWEGPWGEQFENSIKVEVNKIARQCRKLETDYRQNRIAPDFRPDGPTADPDTANMLDGLHRADAYQYQADEARDNAFSEAIRGGFGAYRLANVLEDEYDKDNDNQRINPGILIPDADQRVFFDMGAVRYNKSDAEYAFVLCGWTPEGYKREYDGEPVTWPNGVDRPQFEWYTPELVYTCEYYVKEYVETRLYILTRELTGEEERYWKGEISAEELADREAAGFKVAIKRRKRCRVHKYILSGQSVLEDCGHIAGDKIPIVPVYGTREFIDGMEHFKGRVQDRMDSQRLYNSNISRIAEINSRTPQRVPIFTPEQVAGHEDTWARMHIDRLPYALTNPLTDPNSGAVVASGPVAYVEPPDIPQGVAGLLQIANQDLTEEDVDGADTVKANTSAEAMDIAASRIDSKSALELDNMRKSVEWEAMIYLGMAREVYATPGRKVDLMTEDGDDAQVELFETVMQDGVYKMRHDLTHGRYKVIASVSEATATRRDKTVRMAMNLTEIANAAGAADLAQAALLTAVANMDGEGMDDFKAFARRSGVSIGLFKPNEDEQRQMAEEAEGAQPDATQAVLMAQAEELAASAALKGKQAEKADAEVALTEAKTLEILAKPVDAGGPRIPRGFEL
jgi:hypothetical protein